MLLGCAKNEALLRWASAETSRFESPQFACLYPNLDSGSPPYCLRLCMRACETYGDSRGLVAHISLFFFFFYRASSGEDDDDRTITTYHHLSIRIRLPNNLQVRTSATSQVLTPSCSLTASDEIRNKHSSTQSPARHRQPRNPRIWTSTPLSFVGV